MLISLVAQAPASGRVTLVFGGDVIPHSPVKSAAQAHARYGEDEANNDGWNHVFGPLSLVFRRNDVAVVNLETPVTGLKNPESGEMVFNAPPSLLQGLKAAGVSVATFANNHCRDQGFDGISETRRQLDSAGLLSTGAAPTRGEAWLPLVFERNGLTLGVLSFTRVLNGFQNKKGGGEPFVPVVPYPEEPIAGGISPAVLLETVKAAAERVDALIVTVHWGVEYESAPRKEDRELATQLIEAGALAVIGHHPHVLQPVEPVRRADGTSGVIAFSLGNLVSNQDMGDPDSLKRDSLLLELELVRNRPAQRVGLGRVTPVAVWTENRAASGKARNVQPVVLDEELAAMADRLATLGGRTDAGSRAELAQLTARQALLSRHRTRILAVMSPAWAEAPLATRLAGPLAGTSP